MSKNLAEKDTMEDENEFVTMNSIVDELHTEVDIKEEPVWLEGTSIEANPELEEPVLESEVQSEIKVEAEDIPEIPPKRNRTSKELRLLRRNHLIKRMRRKMQWHQECHNALMEIRAGEHEATMQRLRMNIEILETQIQNQKKMYEFHEQHLKIKQEIQEQRALQLDLLKKLSK